MIDLRLFRNLDFTAGIASGLLSYLVLFAVLFVVPFFLEHARQLSATRAGRRARGVADRARDRGSVRRPRARPDWCAAPDRDRHAARQPCRSACSRLRSGRRLRSSCCSRASAWGLACSRRRTTRRSWRPHRASTRVWRAASSTLTRGLGTAIGVAVTGLVLGLRNAERVHASPHVVTVGFQTCAVVLARRRLGGRRVGAPLRAPSHRPPAVPPAVPPVGPEAAEM